jgi:uracil-DNA glycosylase
MDAEKAPILAATESYHAWWQDAGYDVPCADEAIAWLDDDEDDATDFDAYVRSLEAAEKTKVQPAAQPAQLAKAQPAAHDLPALPNSVIELSDFYAHLSQKTNRPCVAPIGTGQELLCIITDMPTQADSKSGQLFSGEDGLLLANMLKAIGLTRTDVFIMAAIPFFSAANDHQQFGEFLSALLRRQLSFINPRHVLVLGDAGSRFLLNETSAKMRGRLHDINHDNGHISLSTSFHPMGLLKRPQFKRMAWQDLQLVAKALGTL